MIDPLGLSATSFPATSTRIPAPFAYGYFTPYGDVTEAVNPSSAGAAGAMISDVYDVSRFYQALFSGHLLRTAQLRELTDAIPVMAPTIPISAPQCSRRQLLPSAAAPSGEPQGGFGTVPCAGYWLP